MKTRLLLLLFLISVACGHAAQNSKTSAKPIDFSFTLQNEQQRLSAFRDRPLVLIFIRTSEVASQIYMRQVSDAFAKVAGTIRFLVLTVEPTEAPFVQAYAEFEALPFPVGVAETSVRVGMTSLGAIPAIPCTYIIDEDGFIAYVTPGIVNSEDIVKSVQAAMRSK